MEWLVSTWYGIVSIVLASCLFIFLLACNKTLYRLFFKRFFDFVLSLLAIIMLSPVLIILMIIGVIKMKGNPFFVQKRPGKNERIFSLIKFRSMNNAKDKDGNLLPNEQRITKYGKLLRATSLDELPELFNILKGDMSIVGPRPLHVKYLPRYNEIQRHRHDIRPGLTGLAQAMGRNALTWTKKFEYDIDYVNNYSLFLDIKIIFLTFVSVFKKSGINSSNGEFMEEFMGDEQ